MKGKQKQFSRYLQSEYNDYSLEPLEKDSYLYNPTKSNKKTPQKQDKLLQHIESIGEKSKLSGNFYQRWDSSHFLNRQELSKDPFKDFRFELFQNEYSHMKYLELMKNMEESLLFETKTVYDQVFRDHPINFLSCLPQEPIYVWKMTLLHTRAYHLGSSYEEPDSGILASFVVFAQIHVSTREKLIETKFMGPDWIYTKTKQGENQLSLRIYNTDGYLKMRDNFWLSMSMHEVKLIASATFEIDIQNFKNPDGSSLYFKVNWLNQAFNMKNNKICERVHNTTHVFRSSDDLIILVDAENATIVACKADTISTLDCKCVIIKSVHHADNSLFIKSENGKEYQVTFGEFPEMQIQQMDVPEEIKPIIQELNERENRKNKIIAHFSNEEKLYYATRYQLTYRYPRSNKGSESKTKVTVKPDVESKEPQVIKEKKEKSLFEKISQMEKGNKNCKNDEEALEVKNEMLKQIRKDISTKMREISKFDEEYKTEQNGGKTEEVQEPEGVSKEMMYLYAKIKAEKKSLYREKDKKKKKSKQNYDNL